MMYARKLVIIRINIQAAEAAAANSMGRILFCAGSTLIRCVYAFIETYNRYGYSQSSENE